MRENVRSKTIFTFVVEPIFILISEMSIIIILVILLCNMAVSDGAGSICAAETPLSRNNLELEQRERFHGGVIFWLAHSIFIFLEISAQIKPRERSKLTPLWGERRPLPSLVKPAFILSVRLGSTQCATVRHCCTTSTLDLVLNVGIVTFIRAPKARNGRDHWYVVSRLITRFL